MIYYSDANTHGESPGRRLGRGPATLALSGTVDAGELENPIGKARHPHYDDPLRTRALTLLNDRSLSVRQRRTALTATDKDLYLGREFATYESGESAAAQ